jgi:heme A synthase
MSVSAQASQRGGARFNFIVLTLVIALAAYSAYNYAPVAYNAYLFKDFMQETVNKAAYPPAKSNEWVAQQLRAAAREYDLPMDADIKVQNEDGRIVAHVTYTHDVQLPGYVYEYDFDHTARSSGFIK